MTDHIRDVTQMVRRPREGTGVTVIQRICDQCGQRRNTRRHSRCSRIRQQLHQQRSA